MRDDATTISRARRVASFVYTAHDTKSTRPPSLTATAATRTCSSPRRGRNRSPQRSPRPNRPRTQSSSTRRVRSRARYPGRAPATGSAISCSKTQA
eukprot:31034-Pelagococcus_subviridis.AAC.10